MSLAVSLVATVTACGPRRPRVRPVASLATSAEAARVFDPIRRAWVEASIDERKDLRAPLENFIIGFPRDGLTPLARTYVVLLDLDRGDFARADAELRSLEGTVSPGATRDLLTVARAKELRLHGRAQAAYELLRALVGKLVDPVTRSIFQEEVTLAAIDAHQDYEAIAYMDTWLRNAGEDERDAVRKHVAQLLARLPPRVLEDSLRAMRTGGASSGYGRDIQRLVAENLANVAIAKGDVDLARWLLDPQSGTSLLGSDEGALGELATSRRGISAVQGQRIGLVLPTGSSTLREEAADVMRGVAWALGLPRRDGDAGAKGHPAVTLVTRDDGGDPTRLDVTLSELAGDGASIVIAALDGAAADYAIRWGEAHALPIIVLAVPAHEAPRAFTFGIGVALRDELASLAASLVERGVTSAVPVTGGPFTQASIGDLALAPPVPCTSDPDRAAAPSFPVDAWRKEHRRAFLVDAPAECARDLVLQLRQMQAGAAPVTVALTLDASSTRERAPHVRLLAVAAGDIPLARVAAEPAEDPLDADLRAYVDREQANPSFWTALGRDAAALAAASVAALPVDSTADAAEVARRRTHVRDTLLVARLRLWTTRATGFAGAHALPRTLDVVELAAEVRSKAR